MNCDDDFGDMAFYNEAESSNWLRTHVAIFMPNLQELTYIQVNNKGVSIQKMNADIIKQDKILAKIGLHRVMIRQPPIISVYDESKFKSYVTSEYRESQRKETVEIYRMFEFNLLHIESGLRLTLTISESYDGETVEYKIIYMFVINSFDEKF